MEPRGSWKELFLLVLEHGVAGVRFPPRPFGCESGLILLSPSKSPMLFRPVEDDVLKVGGAR